MWVIVASQKVVDYWGLCDHLGLVVCLLTLWREGSEPVIGCFVPFCSDVLDFVQGVVTDGVDVGNGLLLDERAMDREVWGIDRVGGVVWPSVDVVSSPSVACNDGLVVVVAVPIGRRWRSKGWSSFGCWCTGSQMGCSGCWLM